MFFTTFGPFVTLVIVAMRLTVTNGKRETGNGVTTTVEPQLASARSIRWVSGKRKNAGTFKGQRHGYCVYVSNTCMSGQVTRYMGTGKAGVMRIRPQWVGGSWSTRVADGG